MFKKLVLIGLVSVLVLSSIAGCAPKDNSDNGFEYELNEEGIIKPEHAEQIIKDLSDEVMSAIKDEDFDKLSNFTHPDKGVRFTPYTFVSVEDDVVFSKTDVKNFPTDEREIKWGHYDGTGDEIILTPAQYYDKFIYSADFLNADEVGYNTVLSSGNMLENQFEVYETPIIVEYYFPKFNPEYEGMDWKSLRLVFEEHEGSWLLVGIIHNQWTI